MVSEIVFSDVLSMAQTIGIIGTLALTFFFYKRHIQHLAMHTETETIRDLEDKIHRLNIMSFDTSYIIRSAPDQRYTIVLF